MFCKHCGKELSENYKFCINCGSPVSVESSAVVIKSKKEDKAALPLYKRWWFWVIISVTLLVLVSEFLDLFKEQQNTDNPYNNYRQFEEIPDDEEELPKDLQDLFDSFNY